MRRAELRAAISAAAAFLIMAGSSCAIRGPSTQAFTDADLATLLRDRRCGLIAIVSPGMPLSISNLRNVSRIAQAHEIALTVLLDPHAADERAANDLSEFAPAGNALLRNESRTLGLNGGLLHYPSLHVFIEGRLAPEVIYGAKSIESYEALLSQVVASTELSSSARESNDAKCAGLAGLRQNASSQPKESHEALHPDRRFEPGLLSVSPRWTQTGQLEIGRVPKYYFKPMATGAWIAYQAGFSNYLLDLASGREIRVPGTIDPVPSPDERLLTVPSAFATTGLGRLNFFRMDDLMAGRSKTDALAFTDGKIPGTYQSVGQRTENGKTIYRVVSESLYLRKGFYFQDYESTEEGGRIVELRPATRSRRRLCPELSFTLPFLSKTGELFGGVDPITRNTKIFAVSETGACQLRAELGFPTGKVDFSFDDRQVAFHVSPIDSRSVTEVMRRPGDELRLDAYVYDLATRGLERVTDCRDANCYYPSFRRNGEIVYLRQGVRDGSYRFVTTTPGDPNHGVRLPRHHPRLHAPTLIAPAVITPYATIPPATHAKIAPVP